MYISLSHDDVIPEVIKDISKGSVAYGMSWADVYRSQRDMEISVTYRSTENTYTYLSI